VKCIVFINFWECGIAKPGSHLDYRPTRPSVSNLPLQVLSLLKAMCHALVNGLPSTSTLTIQNQGVDGRPRRCVKSADILCNTTAGPSADLQVPTFCSVSNVGKMPTADSG